MTKRPDSLTISLGQDAGRRKDALSALALTLGLNSISELVRFIADIAGDDTASLLRAAANVDGGGDAWITFALVYKLLPPLGLAVNMPAEGQSSQPLIKAFEVIFINDGGERVTRTVDARRVFETYSSRQLRDRALASCTGGDTTDRPSPY